MTTRVTLISPARSESSEEFRFDDGRPLSEAGRRSVRAAAGAAGELWAGAARFVVSPAPRCRETAEALLGGVPGGSPGGAPDGSSGGVLGGAAGEARGGVPEGAPGTDGAGADGAWAQVAAADGAAEAVEDERLAGCAMGRWRGLTLEEVSAAEPENVARWLSDPAAAPHGGESVERLCARAGEWLAETAEVQGRVLAVVEPDVVRAVLVHALGAPAATLWRLDVAPLTATELSGRAGRWNLRAGRELTG